MPGECDVARALPAVEGYSSTDTVADRAFGVIGFGPNLGEPKRFAHHNGRCAFVASLAVVEGRLRSHAAEIGIDIDTCDARFAHNLRWYQKHGP